MRTKKRSAWLAVAMAAGTLGLIGLSGCASTGTLEPLSVATGTSEPVEKEQLRRAVATLIKAEADNSGIDEAVFASDKNIAAYADFLMDSALKKGVPVKDSGLPIAMSVVAYAQAQDDATDAALSSFSESFKCTGITTSKIKLVRVSPAGVIRKS